MFSLMIRRFRSPIRSTPQRLLRSRLRLESLEDRLVLSTITVTSPNDSGPGSLRAAIQQANTDTSSDVIVFNPSLAGQTITLTTADDINTFGPSAFIFRATNPSITIIGSGQRLDTGGQMRHMRLVTGATVTLDNLEFINGSSAGGSGGPGFNGGGGSVALGGSIVNGGTLAIANCLFDGNTAVAGNGGDAVDPSGGGGGGGGVGTNGHSSQGSNGGEGGGTLGGLGGNSSDAEAGGNFGGGGGADAFNNPGAGGFGGGGGGGGQFGLSGGAGGLGGGGGGGTSVAGLGSIFAGDGGKGANGAGGGGGAAFGGAIFNNGRTVLIVNCTFLNNEAEGGDGGNGFGTNSGGGGGGVGFGGAVFNYLGSMTLTNCTFTQNTVTQGSKGTRNGSGTQGTSGGFRGGAAVANFADTTTLFPGNNAVLTMTNCIVANNVGSGDVGNVMNSGTNRSASLDATAPNLITTTIFSSSNAITLTSNTLITADPLLDVLGNNGGLTRTIPLLRNSPALGVGFVGDNIPSTDARGAARNMNSTDLGAFEVNNPLSPIGVPADLFSMYGPHNNPSASATEVYIRGLYQATFHRAADSGGLSFWLGQLNSSTQTRQQVANFFNNSDENRNSQVTFYYNNFLGRGPDSGGLGFWRQQLQAGVDEGTVMQGFLLSPEYAGKNDNAAFVNTMYYAILGRPSDPNGFAFWLGQLTSGVSRATMAVPFIRSPEAINRVVDSFYRTYLKRDGTDTELATALAKIQSGATFGSVAALILGSQEFFSNAVTATP